MRNYQQYIQIDPDVLAGKPVIKNTRIPVSLVLNLMAHGYTIERVIKAYPNLKKNQIIAAIEFAAERLNREEVIPYA